MFLFRYFGEFYRGCITHLKKGENTRTLFVDICLSQTLYVANDDKHFHVLLFLSL